MVLPSATTLKLITISTPSSLLVVALRSINTPTFLFWICPKTHTGWGWVTKNLLYVALFKNAREDCKKSGVQHFMLNLAMCAEQELLLNWVSWNQRGREALENVKWKSSIERFSTMCQSTMPWIRSFKHDRHVHHWPRSWRFSWCVFSSCVHVELHVLKQHRCTPNS